MSTSDQRGPLTRKQLREIRLTGSTPIISEEEAKAAAESAPPAQPLPRAAEPVVVPPAPVAEGPVEPGAAPLTRRQAREQEKIKTASVPAHGTEDHAAHDVAADQQPAAPTEEDDAVDDEVAADADTEAPASTESEQDAPPAAVAQADEVDPNQMSLFDELDGGEGEGR